jgi:DNA primase
LISPETIALIRERTDIVEVVRESVPSLKKRGRAWLGLCPFHKEKTPSFNVNQERGFFKCFGCGESGDVISFLMKELGYTFHEACHSLAERKGIVIEEESRERTEIDRARKQKDDLYSANAVAATWFEEQLKKHPLRSFALDELGRRGIVPGEKPEIDEALKAFRIGYAPNEWDALANYLRQQGISPVAAESVGLLAPRTSGSGHYDRFRHRLMFAVVDTQGRVVAFSGRALADPPNTVRKEGEDKPAKYINSKESPVYTKGNVLFGLFQARQTIRTDEIAIVVEGNFDVFSLHARGLTNVVAPLGTAFTPEQASLLKRHAPKKVILLFDGDAAGRKAVRASRGPCMSAGLMTSVASLPNGEDPDDFVRNRGVEAMKKLVKEAKGSLEFLIDAELDASFVAADVHEKLERVDRILQLITSEQDEIVTMSATLYADHTVARLGLGDESLRALHRKLHAAGRAPRPVAQPTRPRDAPQPMRTSRDPSHTDATDPSRSLPSQPSRDPSQPPRDLASQPPREHGAGVRAPATHTNQRKPIGAAERRDIVGALLDYPSLLGDPEVTAACVHLEGPAVLAIAALRKAWTNEKGLDSAAFLAQIPPAIQGFAQDRFIVPVHETEANAKESLLASAQRLERLILAQEAEQVSREMFRPDDEEDHERSLREITERRSKQLRGASNPTGLATTATGSNARDERAVESPPEGGAKDSGATPYEERPFEEPAGQDHLGKARQGQRPERRHEEDDQAGEERASEGAASEVEPGHPSWTEYENDEEQDDER